jgi:drug/metabolite transporter (DMT)-like permease
MKKLSAPKKVTWWIGLILLIVGAIMLILPKLGVMIPYAGVGAWLLLISALLYALATAMKGL